MTLLGHKNNNTTYATLIMRYTYSPAIPHTVGHGLPVFEGTLYQQRGGGIGGLLASLARKAIPLLLPLGKRIGKSLLHSGGKLAKDVILKRRPLKKAMRRHASEAISNIIDTKAKKRKKISKTSLAPKKRLRKKITSDIFKKIDHGNFNDTY